jgi:hypothetical protein
MLAPLCARQFRRQLATYLMLQLMGSCLAAGVYFFINPLAGYGILVGFQLFLCSFFSINKLKARLASIYPEEVSISGATGLYVVTPLTNLPLLLFLGLRQTPIRGRAPIYLRNWFCALLVVLGIFNGHVLTKFLYNGNRGDLAHIQLINSPSGQYIAKITEDVNWVFNFEKAREAKTVNVIEEIERAHHQRKFDHTGKILLAAIVAQEAADRKPANNTERVRLGLKLVEDLFYLEELKGSNGFLNPLYLLSPVSMIELGLLGGLNHHLNESYNSGMRKRLQALITQASKKMEADQIHDPELTAKLNSLKQKF